MEDFISIDDFIKVIRNSNQYLLDIFCKYFSVKISNNILSSKYCNPFFLEIILNALSEEEGKKFLNSTFKYFGPNVSASVFKQKVINVIQNHFVNTVDDVYVSQKESLVGLSQKSLNIFIQNGYTNVKKIFYESSDINVLREKIKVLGIKNKKDIFIIEKFYVRYINQILLSNVQLKPAQRAALIYKAYVQDAHLIFDLLTKDQMFNHLKNHPVFHFFRASRLNDTIRYSLNMGMFHKVFYDECDIFTFMLPVIFEFIHLCTFFVKHVSKVISDKTVITTTARFAVASDIQGESYLGSAVIALAEEYNTVQLLKFEDFLRKYVVSDKDAYAYTIGITKGFYHEWEYQSVSAKGLLVRNVEKLPKEFEKACEEVTFTQYENYVGLADLTFTVQLTKNLTREIVEEECYKFGVLVAGFSFFSLFNKDFYHRVLMGDLKEYPSHIEIFNYNKLRKKDIQSIIDYLAKFPYDGKNVFYDYLKITDN